MKLLTYQPFSLYSNGGGNRILRRLFKGREDDVISLVVEETALNPKKGPIDETVIYAQPVVQKWARWKLRQWITWLRHGWFKASTIKKVQQAAAKIPYDVLHVVDHGPYSAALCDREVNDKPLWVSFHDHYSTTYGSQENSRKLWTAAVRRLVISEQLGREYSRLFGELPYELITDGVAHDELSEPKAGAGERITIYFAGLLHIAYIPLFKAFADALDLLEDKGYKLALILRGTQDLPFLNGRKFETQYRQVSLDDKVLKDELDASTILYLPIKFSVPDFYLYSLSTKMVGYLGAGGAILYHGPTDSAACKLLTSASAAQCSTTLNADAIAEDILSLLTNGKALSYNAKKLAKERFTLQDIQKRFWFDNP